MAEAMVERKLWRAAIMQKLTPCFRESAASRMEALKGMAADGIILHLGLYLWADSVFLYYEALRPGVEPDFLFPEATGFLALWPGEREPRPWIRLIDIFHFNEPASVDHWRRKRPVGWQIGQMGRLKPETIPHYLFYHYALQEEQAFPGDKYEIIGISENLLFAYREKPEEFESPLYPPRLEAKVVPSNWDSVDIPSCFIPWPDLPGVCLRPMDPVLTL